VIYFVALGDLFVVILVFGENIQAEDPDSKYWLMRISLSCKYIRYIYLKQFLVKE
jgi:hypothetical protein